MTLTDDEIDGIKAYIPRFGIARWPKGFKSVPIKKYDGQTNPQEWLQLYSMAIQSAGGDSYVMANYLPDCLDPAIRIWLKSLLEEAITSWNRDLKLTAQECFEIAVKFASGESALDDIRGKGKEKRSDKPESSKKDKKKKPDNMVHMVD
ncbi:hypothetical protein PR202_gb26001 [Eleusine coracana subsp. coracana]|uniref:Uncharacterized protein n=1 Tax=Eleusine coracana subsp. coracana TaxID=191504 RepID=A0AAV5FN36_ELECO|nr:hypothetical protein PR202_gb26001 [Eleusine coracana subsp. coracana]